MKTKTEQWIERYEAVEWNTFGRRRIVLARGQGTRVWDIEGKEYLDFLTGIAVNNLGHCHPAIVEAIREQAGELIHCTNLYYVPAQIEWAELLTRNSFGGRVFFGNSGAEATEALIKLARKYATAHFAPERRNIICTLNSFHGRTLGTLSATGQEKIQTGFHPFLPGFKFVPYNDCEAMRAAVDETVCAILVEPVQGEGGVLPATQAFMDTLADLRARHGLLLLFDEVQTGLGRTGKNFAYQHFGVVPDALSLAKPLAGGMAAGAVIAREEVAAAMTPGSHGSTMGGNPMASAAGRAYCRVLFEEKLADRAAAVGGKMLAELRGWVGQVPCVKEVRGLGLMIGIQLDRPGAKVVERCEKRGLLINCTANTVIRLLPPLNVKEKEIREALAILKEALQTKNEGA
jgi:predicted acetylornithine/succinylornithine family transaminase